MSGNCTFSQIYISVELIILILYKLPAKSLLRFMSVCKLWHSLIKNPNFISSHFNHHINQKPRYLLYCDSEKHNQYYVHKDIDSFDRHLEFSFTNPNTLLTVGCCNGIVCFVEKDFDTYLMLWNYSSRKSLDIKVPHNNICEKEKCAYWFGFDEISNDYKVVCVGYLIDGDFETKVRFVYIYSLNERTWKLVNSSFVLGEVGLSKFGGVYLNGVIHWGFQRIYGNRKIRGMPVLILTFNLADETLGVFNVPHEMVGVNAPYVRSSILLEWVDLMTMKRSCKNCLVILNEEEWLNLSLWVMEEEGIVGSSKKYFDEQLEWYIRMILNVRMAMQRYKGGIVSLDNRDMTVKLLSTENMDYVGTYVETLLLL